MLVQVARVVTTELRTVTGYTSYPNYANLKLRNFIIAQIKKLK